MIMQPQYKIRYLNSNTEIITLDEYNDAKSSNIDVFRAGVGWMHVPLLVNNPKFLFIVIN